MGLGCLQKRSAIRCRRSRMRRAAILTADSEIVLQDEVVEGLLDREEGGDISGRCSTDRVAKALVSEATLSVVLWLDLRVQGKHPFQGWTRRYLRVVEGLRGMRDFERSEALWRKVRVNVGIVIVRSQ